MELSSEFLLEAVGTKPQGFGNCFQWLGNDQRQLDPTELDLEFHTHTKVLLEEDDPTFEPHDTTFEWRHAENLVLLDRLSDLPAVNG